MSGLGVRCPIIPPYLLRQLARSGALDPTAVEDTLRIDAGFRAPRAAPDLLGAAEDRAGVDPSGRARWTVHDAEHGTVLPGTPVRAEGEPESGDVAVDEAAAGITATLDLFAEAYGRDSYDGAGAPVPLTVHYGRDYANAFWDGRHLVFGDGDGRVFGRFTAALDVLAHELTHAVTEYSAGLVYADQSGALNESMSDVFGACAAQRARREDAASASWLIGQGIFLPGVRARALRDMAEPGTAYDDPVLGTDPQPAHMDDYVRTSDDNGGVHLNSGIPNRAFVLAARAIGGSSAEGAGRIWYAALTSGRVRPDADFATFAAVTVSLAGEHADRVRSAWETVGVSPGGSVGEGEGEGPDNVAVPPDLVTVRRSGGLLGRPREGSLDLASPGPRAERARGLVERCDLSTAGAGPAQPDRFVYDFVLRGSRVRLPEQELTPELAALAELLLDDRDRDQ